MVVSDKTMQDLKKSHQNRKKPEIDLPDALEALRGAFGFGPAKKVPENGNGGSNENEILNQLQLQIRLQVCTQN